MNHPAKLDPWQKYLAQLHTGAPRNADVRTIIGSHSAPFVSNGKVFVGREFWWGGLIESHMEELFAIGEFLCDRPWWDAWVAEGKPGPSFGAWRTTQLARCTKEELLESSKTARLPASLGFA